MLRRHQVPQLLPITKADSNKPPPKGASGQSGFKIRTIAEDLPSDLLRAIELLRISGEPRLVSAFTKEVENSFGKIGRHALKVVHGAAILILIKH